MQPVLDFLISPAALYGFYALGLVLALSLFLTLKREIRRLERRCAAQQNLVTNLMAGTGAELEELKTRLKECEERSGMLVAPQPTLTGLNLNKRSQILRMLRLGEPADRICSALGVKPQEVELLDKVRIMLAETEPQVQ